MSSGNRKGRVPGKGNVIIDEEFLKKAEKEAASGGSYIAIAHALGIAESTLHKHKKKAAAFREALKRGQGQAIREVENALFKDAKSGVTTAQIFFLKNRCPEEWRDRHEVEAKVDVSASDALEWVRKQDEDVQLERQQNTEDPIEEESEYMRH
ncbi:hypothetical protein [Endozoicomonas sp.]|uniref:hypothetical protein n=1 Tax=Endozoicomonas sp. TaxID=1892382 RepID=UPI002883BC8A|nr:hypothetical protein [Endozoicomonas sp.]